MCKRTSDHVAPAVASRSMRRSGAPAKGDAVTWTISKPKAGSYYVVKASDKPWFLLLKDDSARPLMEAAGREKLFATAPKTNALASRKPAGPAPKPR